VKVRWGLWWSGVAALAVIALAPAASVYYESRGGPGCARCHEIAPIYETWHASTHRKIACSACHGDAATLDAGFHLNNLKRVVEHLRGRVPEQIKMRAVDIPAMLQRCQSCHRQEFADWETGPHGVTYSKIFLNAEQNRKKAPMDDCLRCHGAHFAGSIRDLVTQPDRQGPWKLVAGMENQPAIPCMACHQVHRQGAPMQRAQAGIASSPAAQEVVRPSVALFDRRSMMHVAVARLSLPEMRDGDRVVRMSPDPRQALCYQCHAPVAGGFQAGSGDDRTGLGVHEGLSCLACHFKHGQKTRASCVECHPRLSNCGLDVEKMDTTFFNSKSKHNIHFVKCGDCHVKGVPKRDRR
jgi:Cytochrome c554 and c-prime